MQTFINMTYYFLKTFFILCALLLLQGCLGSIDTDQKFDGGSGTEKNPYRVSHVLQLQLIAEETYLDKHFIQVNNIDASPSAEFQNGSGFKHIGDRESPFTGSYNGNGFVIRDLHLNIQRSGDQHTGLFGYAKNARLENITIDNSAQLAQQKQSMTEHFALSPGAFQVVPIPPQHVDLSDARGIGGLAGFNDGGLISNCRFTGRVSGNISHSVGGLAGLNTGLIENSHFEGTVFGGGGIGFVGWNTGKIINSSATGIISGMTAYGLVSFNFGEIIRSFASVEVTASHESAGLVGRNEEGGRIFASYVFGKVMGNQRSAGLAVYNNGEISNSYSMAAVDVSFVTGFEDMKAGGLVIENRANGLISHSYAAGPLIITGGPGKITGLAGRNDGTITASFWDTEATGQNEGVGDGNPDGATGLTTGQMSGPAAQANMPEFDWQTVWRTTSGYPVLRWQGGE